MRDKKSQALELGFEMARFRLLDNFVETSKFDEFQKLFASYFWVSNMIVGAKLREI